MFTVINAQVVSDMGCVRQNNEDMILLNGEYYRDETANQRFELLQSSRFKALVADGMGGTEGGEFASEIAVQAFEQFLDDLTENLSDSDLRTAVANWTMQTHNAILQKGVEFPQYNQMGTTLTGIFGYGNRIYLINIGDSRVYRCRSGILKQLSRDHSMRELHHDPTIASNLIYNCLGGGAPDAFADITDITEQVLSEDVFLICSDGLSDMLSDDEIESVFARTPFDNAEVNVAQALVEAAKAAGGKDNISVLVLQILGD